MKRPMLCWVILLVLGDVIVRYGSVWCLGGIAAGMGIGIAAIRTPYIVENRRWLYIGVVCLLLGGAVCGYEQYKQQICCVENGSRLSFCGTITDREERTTGLRYQVAVTRLQNVRICVNIVIPSEEEWQIGDRIAGEGQVENFETATNPGGFDERNYQLGKGNVWKLEQVKLMERRPALLPVKATLYRIRERIAQVYGQLFSEVDASLAGAMVLGDRTNLDADVKQMYQRNGIAHLIAISGVKTLKLDIPLVLETRINWGFVPLHIAIIYILKLCLGEEIIPRCRFPCSRGYLIKCINWQKKQSFSVSQSYRKS